MTRWGYRYGGSRHRDTLAYPDSPKTRNKNGVQSTPGAVPYNVKLSYPGSSTPGTNPPKQPFQKNMDIQGVT